MAILVGTTGSITLVDATSGTVCVLARKWTLSMRRPSTECFIFNATNNVKQRIAGPYSWSGTFSGYLDGTIKFDETNFNTATQAAAAVTLTAATTAGVTDLAFTGSGWLTSISPNVEVATPVTVEGTFVITGDITSSVTG